MKTKLKLMFFTGLITLTFFSMSYVFFTSDDEEERAIELVEKDTQVIPIVAFDIFQLFLNN
jgi:hypothetical protein